MNMFRVLISVISNLGGRGYLLMAISHVSFQGELTVSIFLLKSVISSEAGPTTPVIFF